MSCRLSTAADKTSVRILWNRVGRLGHVSLYSEYLDAAEAVQLCRAVVARAADEWITQPPSAVIKIQQPDPIWINGAVEIEMVEDRLETVRDIARAVLCDAGFTVR